MGDQRLLYRAAEKKELERSLDPPPLSNNDKSSSSGGGRRNTNVNEPVVAFGPPGTIGELNVSVIVSPVPLDFKYALSLFLFLVLFCVPRWTICASTHPDSG